MAERRPYQTIRYARVKKVSDIFTDAKVPVDRKSGIPIVAKGDRILWVAGLRAASHYPVTDATRRIVVLKIRKQS